MKTNRGMMQEMREYEKTHADTAELAWAVWGQAFMQRHNLWDMREWIVRIACGYGIIYASDEATEAAQDVCYENWTNWLRSLV